MRLVGAIFGVLLSLLSADAAWISSRTNSAGNVLVTITSPSAGGTVTGSVNLQASCPAAFGCTSVSWIVDGIPVGSASASPFTFAFNTAVYADGKHTITAVGTSSRGAKVPANPVTISTSNSISNKTVFISGAGNDSNSCLTALLACATPQKANTFTYYGGDTIAIDAANPITVNNPTATTELTLLGPSSTLGTQNFFGMGRVLTITSYNGSGNCDPIAGVTTNCATINITGTTAAGQTGIINVVNASYVTVTNVRGVATSNSVAANNNILYGVNLGSASSINNYNVVVQNCEFEDVAIGVYDTNTLGQFYTTSGTRSNTVVQNCWLHGSTKTSKMEWGIEVQGTSNSLVQNNLVENIGSSTYNGVAGIHVKDGAQGATVQFNVIRYVGANNTSCGGPYGFETYGAINTIVQFNESYSNGPYPTFVSGCDMGNYDLDGGTSGTLFQYNYGHDGWGNALLMYNTNDTGGRTWHDNTVRFNIWEHDATTTVGGVTSGGANVITVGTGGAGTNGTAYIYNNTIWDNAQGVSNKNIYPIAFSTCLASPSFIANNIFAATQNAGFSSTQTGVANFDLQTCTAITWKANDWYSITSGKTPIWTQWGSTNPATLAAWQAVAGGGDTGATEANPMVTSGGSGGTCYSSGDPAGPQPCPSSYVLLSGSELLGAGIDLRVPPYNQVITRDYYGNSCSGPVVNFNIGADGCRSSCPQGSAFPDGCPGAPLAPIPFPNALNGGGYSGQSWATRSPWNVAGVDYGVGVPTGTTLIDWQTIVGAGGTGPNTLTTNGATASGNVLHFASTSGVLIGMPVTGTNIPGSTTITAYTPTTITISNNVTSTGVANGATITINSGGSAVSTSGVNFSINSNNVVVDSIDFSLHGGAQAIVHGSGVTIKNSNFFYGTGCTTVCTYLINVLGGASNFTLLNSTLDGNGITLGTSTAQASLMSMNGGGSFTAKYNLFKNQLQHTLEYNTASALVYQYNVFYNVTCNGSCGTPHMNFLQWGNQDQGTALVSYNFVYQPNDAGVGGQGIQFTPGALVAAMSFVLANNTMIYSPSGAGITDAHGNVSNQTGLIYQNYVDSRGNAFFFGDSTACPLDGSLNVYGAACSSGNPSNINPVTGAAITTTP